MRDASDLPESGSSVRQNDDRSTFGDIDGLFRDVVALTAQCLARRCERGLVEVGEQHLPAAAEPSCDCRPHTAHADDDDDVLVHPCLP